MQRFIFDTDPTCTFFSWSTETVLYSITVFHLKKSIQIFPTHWLNIDETSSGSVGNLLKNLCNKTDSTLDALSYLHTSHENNWSHGCLHFLMLEREDERLLNELELLSPQYALHLWWMLTGFPASMMPWNFHLVLSPEIIFKETWRLFFFFTSYFYLTHNLICTNRRLTCERSIPCAREIKSISNMCSVISIMQRCEY